MQCVLLVKHLMMSLVMRVPKVVNKVEDEKKGREGVPRSIRGGNCLILSGFYQSEGHREIGHRRDL
jgi:hypothetical protein